MTIVNNTTFRYLFIALIGIGLFGACKKDEETDGNPDKTPVVEKIPFSGKYVWEFSVGPAVQQSTHVFYADSIAYTMAGPVHSTAYTQLLEKYEPLEKRCITVGQGGGKDGVYFVMFFKELTDSSVTIYKRQCADKNEAETIAIPADDTTADYGWNVYVKQ